MNPVAVAEWRTHLENSLIPGIGPEISKLFTLPY